jgi:hypothetical protein
MYCTCERARGQRQHTFGLVSLIPGRFLLFFALSVRTALAGVLSVANLLTPLLLLVSLLLLLVIDVPGMPAVNGIIK